MEELLGELKVMVGVRATMWGTHGSYDVISLRKTVAGLQRGGLHLFSQRSLALSQLS